MEAHHSIGEVGGEFQNWEGRKTCLEVGLVNETDGNMILGFIMGLNRWKLMAVFKEGKGVAQDNWSLAEQFDYGPSPLEKKRLKIKHLVLVICKGLTMTMCLGKGKFKNIGLFCGLKEDDSGPWAEVNTTYWSQELGKFLLQHWRAYCGGLLVNK